MKLLYISGSILPSPHANSVHVMSMCDAFTKVESALEVHLCASRGDPLRQAEIAQIYGVQNSAFDLHLIDRSSRFSSLSYCHSVGAIAAELRPDVIYSRHLAALLYSYRLGRHHVYELHSMPSERWQVWAIKWLSRTPCQFVCISDALRNDLLSRYPNISPNRVLVAHDGAFPGPPRAAPPSANHRVGYTGSFYRGRGLELIADLASQLPEFQFNLYGGHLERFLDVTGKSGVSDNLLVHGYINPSAIRGTLDSQSILLAPYQKSVSIGKEGLDTSRWMSPLKVFEYMASGRAIIASDLPVLREVLKPYVNAVLVAPDDLNEWIDALNLLANNSDLATEIGIQAREDLVDKFSWEARASSILRWIRTSQKGFAL